MNLYLYLMALLFHNNSNGAGRVCGEETRGEPVDIGNMSRDWKSSEASTEDSYTFDCLVGDATRSAIQIDVSPRDAFKVALLGYLMVVSCVFKPT